MKKSFRTTMPCIPSRLRLLGVMARNFDSSNGERIEITDLQCNIRGSGLLIAKKSENASFQSASGLVRRYSSR